MRWLTFWLFLMAAVLPAAKGEDMISANLPAGNIIVKKIDGKNITLDNDDRDSGQEWFYWKFKAVFPEKGVYRFRFARANKVGPRGACVSTDKGQSWRWQTDKQHADAGGFTYNCETPGEVWFCQAWPYLPGDWEKFTAEHAGKSYLTLKTLCQSKKGRGVPLAVIKEGAPEFTLLLTARHHAQESMASNVLEGILRSVLADDDFGREFRRKIAVYVVPFVDRDGVEDGDQGKARKPHDHNRDYTDFLYPEIRALAELVKEVRPAVHFDLHCPWLRGGCNEYMYLVGSENKQFAAQMDVFAGLLEKHAPACAPYRKADNILFGTLWNTSKNYTAGMSSVRYFATLPFFKYSQSVEIPFANLREKTFDRPGALEFGKNMAKAILEYHKGN